jgi:hypothetical protein
MTAIFSTIKNNHLVKTPSDISNIYEQLNDNKINAPTLDVIIAQISKQGKNNEQYFSICCEHLAKEGMMIPDSLKNILVNIKQKKEKIAEDISLDDIISPQMDTSDIYPELLEELTNSINSYNTIKFSEREKLLSSVYSSLFQKFILTDIEKIQERESKEKDIDSMEI